MSEVIKMQEQLKKIIPNSSPTVTTTIGELSDNQLEVLAGGQSQTLTFSFACFNLTKIYKTTDKHGNLLNLPLRNIGVADFNDD